MFHIDNEGESLTLKLCHLIEFTNCHFVPMCPPIVPKLGDTFSTVLNFLTNFFAELFSLLKRQIYQFKT
jgi:hypothetical protein